jgi:predicted nucleic acid-binding protein
LTRFALDTSVSIPLLVEAHEAHGAVSAWAVGRVLGLSGHALAETYSVLTRLPGDSRVAPADAVALIDDNFPELFMLSPDASSRSHRELEQRGVSGGATYDGLVALAAREHGAVLITRDARARSTYEAVGAEVEVLHQRSTPRKDHR